MPGRTLAIYAPTGSGKTTQLGEEAKRVYAETGRRTLLRAIDEGGYDSIEHLVGPSGIIDIDALGDANPWVWIQERTQVTPDPAVYGLTAFDSGTGIGDALLKHAAQLAAKGVQVGQQRVFNLKIPGTDLVVGANNESQYGLIQTFLLDQIGKASRIAANNDIDVIWTFGEHFPDLSKGEPPIIGPKLVGKALTAHLPRHIRYTLRMVKVLEPGSPAVHRLLTMPGKDENGIEFLVNPRFPLNPEIEQPQWIEPASIPEFWNLIARAKEAALKM